MPSSSAIEAGRAFLKLFVNDDEFRKGLNKSLSSVRAFSRSLMSVGTAVGAAGAAMTAPFVASLKIFADVGSQLHDMSQRTGITVEKLSALRLAAQQSGTSLETIATAAREMVKNGLDPNTFTDVARRIAAIEDPVKRAQAAMEAFGRRSGMQLLPTINGLDKAIEKFEKLGLTMTTEGAAKADALGDAMDTLKASLGAVALTIGEALAPRITEFSEAITAQIAEINQWVKANEGLTVSLLAIGGSLSVIGGAMTAVALAINQVVAAAVKLAPYATLIGRVAAGATAFGVGSELGAAKFAYLDSLVGKGGGGGGGGPTGFFGPLLNPFAINSLIRSGNSSSPNRRPAIGTPGGNPLGGFGSLLQVLEPFDLAAMAEQVLSKQRNADDLQRMAAGVLDKYKSGLGGFSGPSGTFSGQLASQIFGNGAKSKEAMILEKHTKFLANQEKHLARIASRRAILMGGR